MGNISKRLDEIKGQLNEQKLAEEAFEFFRDTTPVATGNARRRTQLRGNTIEAAYPYAQRLDNGYSRQAPNGMTAPTLAHIQKMIQDNSKKG